MKTQIEIERLADETLKSIEGIKPVEANDYLFTRIESQLLADSGQQAIIAARFLSRLSIALVLFIGLNTVTYYFLYDNGKAPKTATNTKPNTAAQAFASEYHLISSDYNY